MPKVYPCRSGRCEKCRSGHHFRCWILSSFCIQNMFSSALKAMSDQLPNIVWSLLKIEFHLRWFYWYIWTFVWAQERSKHNKTEYLQSVKKKLKSFMNVNLTHLGRYYMLKYYVGLYVSRYLLYILYWTKYLQLAKFIH